MSNDTNSIRIPNLPNGRIVDDNGNPTLDFLTFMQTFVTNMQRLFGDEGMVAPQQIADDITIIQNNTTPNAAQPDVPVYSCAPGTFIYNSTNDTIMVSILAAGVPQFKTITVSP